MMRWTKTKPSSAGYYWRRGRRSKIPIVVLVTFDRSVGWVVQGHAAVRLSDKMWGSHDWSGPIQEPK